MQVQQLGICKVKNHARKLVNYLYVTVVCVRACVRACVCACTHARGAHPHMRMCIEHSFTYICLPNQIKEWKQKNNGTSLADYSAQKKLKTNIYCQCLT